MMYNFSASSFSSSLTAQDHDLMAGERKDQFGSTYEVAHSLGTSSIASSTVKQEQEINADDVKKNQMIEPQSKTMQRKEILGVIHVQFVCDICDRSFASSASRFEHKVTHHGQTTHECGVCKKRFIDKRDLKKHMPIHTGERNHRCTVCGKAFKYASNLYTHMKIHTGEKNHECCECGKKFITAFAMRQHMVVHTGKRKYECNACGEKFAQCSSLSRHNIMQLH